MNYTEAVRLVKQGDENGFNFLYEETYKRTVPICISLWSGQYEKWKPIKEGDK